MNAGSATPGTGSADCGLSHTEPRATSIGSVPVALARDLVRLFLKDSERRRVQPGEVIFRRGEAGDAFFLIGRGRVRIEVPGMRTNGVLAELGSGEFFGEMALLTGEPRSATAVALTPTVLHVVTRQVFWDLLGSRPTLAIEITQYLSHRLRERSILSTPAAPRVVLLLAAGSARDEVLFCSQLAQALADLTAPAVALIDTTADPLGELSVWPRMTTRPVCLINTPPVDISAAKRDYQLLVVRARPDSPDVGAWLAEADVLLLLDFEEAPWPDRVTPWDKCRVMLCEIRRDRPGPFCTTNTSTVPIVRLPVNAAGVDPPVLRHLARRILRRQVGLALSAGGAKGFAHLGAAQVLSHAGIEFDAIAGTSMGGIVGGLLATGQEVQSLMSEFAVLAKDFRRMLLDFALPEVALLRGEKKRLLLEARTNGRNIDDLPIPFAAVAADLVSGREAVFASGSLSLALDATSAIPMIFPPVYAQGRAWVDGWMVNPLPTDVLRRLGADVVIAVDTSIQAASPPALYQRKNVTANRFSHWRSPPAIINVAIRALEVGARERSLASLAGADVSICPDVDSFSPTDFRPLSAIAERGVDAAQAALPAVQASVQSGVDLI